MTDICASYLTLSGSAYGDPPKYTMLERAQAAHDAGITSIGVRIDEPVQFRAMSYVNIDECEWVDLGRPLTRGTASDLLAMAHGLGATRLNAGACDPGVSLSTALENLKALLDITEPLGMTVAVEPVAFGSFRTIGEIRDLLMHIPLGYHCGMLFDFFQVAYPLGGLNNLVLDRLPPLAEIQACGYRRNDNRYAFGASQDRPAAGDEERLYLENLREWLPHVPVSYELPNAARRKMTLKQMAEAAAADMALLD